MRGIIAITVAVAVGLMAGHSKAALLSLDELYQIVLQQQKTIEHLSKKVEELSNSNGVRQVSRTQLPEPFLQIENTNVVDGKAKPKMGNPNASLDGVEQARGPIKKREAANSDGFYVTAHMEYAIPENVKVTNNLKNEIGDASLSEGLNLGLAAGYRFNENFRGDIEIGRRTHELGQVTSETRNPVDVLGQAELYTATVNGYFDFPKIASLKLGKSLLRPYIGAGIGGGYLKANDVSFLEISTRSREARSDSIWLPVGQLTAGVSYKLTPDSALDLGYRFFALGDISGTKESRSGKSTVFKSHNVKVGLRFYFN